MYVYIYILYGKGPVKTYWVEAGSTTQRIKSSKHKKGQRKIDKQAIILATTNMGSTGEMRFIVANWQNMCICIYLYTYNIYIYDFICVYIYILYVSRFSGGHKTCPRVKQLINQGSANKRSK